MPDPHHPPHHTLAHPMSAVQHPSTHRHHDVPHIRPRRVGCGPIKQPAIHNAIGLPGWRQRSGYVRHPGLHVPPVAPPAPAIAPRACSMMQGKREASVWWLVGGQEGWAGGRGVNSLRGSSLQDALLGCVLLASGFLALNPAPCCAPKLRQPLSPCSLGVVPCSTSSAQPQVMPPLENSRERRCPFTVNTCWLTQNSPQPYSSEPWPGR